MTQRLTWYLLVCLSLLLLWGQRDFAASVFERDATYISLSLTAAYLVITGWIGVATHTHLEPPYRIARFFADQAPNVGLIGTVIGIILLFGLHGDGDIDEARILSGVGIAVYTTLTGVVWSVFMRAQMAVLRA